MVVENINTQTPIHKGKGENKRQKAEGGRQKAEGGLPPSG
jgi:hypothetical protein